MQQVKPAKRNKNQENLPIFNVVKAIADEFVASSFTRRQEFWIYLSLFITVAQYP